MISYWYQMHNQYNISIFLYVLLKYICSMHSIVYNYTVSSYIILDWVLMHKGLTALPKLATTEHK